jgi:hypothetical protein
MSLTIIADTSILQKSLAGIAADMAWVNQNGINNTLKGAQQKQYETMRNNFTIRNESFLKNSVRLQFATKQRQTGRIFIADLGGKKTSDIWNKFEGGGTKSPTKSKNIAVPTDEAWPNKGKVKPIRNKPRNLKRSFVIRDGANTFILSRTGRGTRRTGSGRDTNLKLMYVLTNSVPIPDRLNFYSTIIPYINRTIDSNIMDAFMYSARKNGFKG